MELVGTSFPALKRLNVQAYCGLRKARIFTTASDMATAWRPIPVCNCLFIICSIQFTKLPIHLSVVLTWYKDSREPEKQLHIVQ